MADAIDVASQVREHLDRWNSPAEDNSLNALVGQPAPEGDGRATANTGPTNPYADSADLAEVPTDDDGNPDYSKMKNADLEAHLKARGLSTAGNKEEMVERLEDDDDEG
jgi:hypothetical protein